VSSQVPGGPRSSRAVVPATARGFREPVMAPDIQAPLSVFASISLAPPELGLPAALAVILLMDAGVPIPIPTDFLLLVVGERAAAGVFPIWAAAIGLEVVAIVSTSVLFLALRGPANVVISRFGSRVGLTPSRMRWATSLLERRGRGFLAVGRSTPGLRTITVFTAATAKLQPAYALPAMVMGSTIFLQGHLVLGFLLGPLADQALDRAKLPVLVGIVALLGLGLVVWRVRRGKGRGGIQAWTEASCPACLGVALIVGRTDATSVGEH
jgi:membrane protein DedA with SNARE-associated domain